MLELTEQQVQEMIDRARTGDPEANYQMSQWALDQALAEPEEERWNRLAAKCLVRAAEAGYAPAQERMDELIQQLEQEENDRSGAAPAPREPTAYPERSAPAEKRPAAKGASGVIAKIGGFFRGLGSSSDKKSGEKTSAPKGRPFRFSEWNDAQWKKLQRICLIVCAVLAVFILILLISHGARKDKEPEPVETTPEVVITPEPVVPTPTPAVAVYPDEATRARIAAATLDVYPDDADYVTTQTNATVSTTSNDLNMRRGTNADATYITSIPNGTSVEVYARKNGWALVQYGNDIGWCSADYLK